ncbi:trafficking protein particle complex subunit 8 [Centruroides vittatus]|uniref:trafficking protein particle complex subunit 8 n=1 Tax=Centruroides vittatus TaxID=120091 RepID=UPI00350F3FA7
MAACKQTSQEFIQDVFSPMVAVLCSQDAKNTCKKNNLTFVELLQPFCRINTEVTIRDPSNISFTIRSLHIIVRDMKYQSPSPVTAKKMMHDAVLNTYTIATDDVLCNRLNNGNYSLKYFSSTPWFEAYREVFFQVMYPSEHEFTHHYLACIFVVSSSHVDPIGQINELNHQQEQYQQQSSSHSGARWFFSSVLKYYVLLHDVSEENISKAEAVYQNMKSTYGAGVCHLLQINSKTLNETNNLEKDENDESVNLPDPWSQFLAKTIDHNTSENEASKFPEENHFSFPEHIYEDQSEEIDGITENNLSIQHPLSLNTENELPASDSFISSPVGEETNFSKTYGQNGEKKIKENKIHGVYLTLSDRERIRVFIQDFCIQGLLPYVEKQIRNLNDQVANRKGIHRSLFSATKKWFSGSKPGMQGPTSSSTSVIYSQDAPELQVRKLGDLAFMFQLYDLAYQAYHSAKRDFSNDQAWLHYAGATEMAALSVFMMGSSSQRQFPTHYMDSAITTYLNTCKSSVFATRATLLSTECLKNKGLYSEAALHFIRMTSEDSDLRSALLLEQAAHCFLNTKPPMIRKYAFHVILAGHRFSKAGQRKHALRAYKLAEQVYKEKNWRLADDHINFIIGRQSVNLKQLENACTAFESLLKEHSLQSATQQATFLREYLFVLNILNESKDQQLPLFPLPKFDCQSIKVLFGQINENVDEMAFVNGRKFDKANWNNNTWIYLANLVVTAAQGFLPISHHPQLQCLAENTDNSIRPLSVVGEIITIELQIRNPLAIPLVLTNVFLLWTFIPKDSSQESTHLTNETSSFKTSVSDPVLSKVLQEVNFDGQETKTIHLFIQPLMIGELHITGVSYTIQTLTSSNQQTTNGEMCEMEIASPKLLNNPCISIRGKQNLELIGRRLNNTKAEKAGKVYGPDYRLKPIIIGHMPKLQVKFNNFIPTFFCGEVRLMNIEFTNIGHCALNRILIASSNPELFVIGTPGYESNGWMVYKENACNEKFSPVMAECPNIEAICEIITLDGNSCELTPKESLIVPMWLRGPDVPGDHTIDFLFYYETKEFQTKMKYRLLQYSLNITALPSLSFKTESTWSSSFSNNSLTQCTSSANSFVLFLEAHNVSEIERTEITILQVSSVSQDWCLYPLSEVEGQGTISIRPQESILLSMKAMPFNSKYTVTGKNVMVFSQVPFGRTEVDSSSTPCSDFSWRSQLRLNNQKLINDDVLDINVQNEIISMTKDTENFGLVLTVLWKAKMEKDNQTHVVVGQHHIVLNKVDSSVLTLPEEKSFEQNPPIYIIPDLEENEKIHLNLTEQAIKCTINHPFHVKHNFLYKRLLSIPVILVAHNCSQVDAYVFIDLQEIRSVTPSPVSTPQSLQEVYRGLGSQGFTWIGPSQRQFCLKSGSTIHVPLQACFSAPGTYLMGNLQISSGLEKHGAKIWQQCMPPCLIIISDNK